MSPHKAIIFGEYIVVLPNYPGIAGTIDRHKYVSAQKTDVDLRIIGSIYGEFASDKKYISRFIENVEDAKLKFRQGDSETLENLMKSFDFSLPVYSAGIVLDYLKEDKSIELKISGNSLSGCGSSASLAVAIPKAIGAEVGHELSETELEELSYTVDEAMHGVPSGIDTNTIRMGNIIKYVKDERGEKTFEPLNVQELEGFYLVPGKHERSTRDLVNEFLTVGNFKAPPKKWDVKYKGYVDEIRRIVIEGENALKRGNLKEIEYLMNENQKYLEKFEFTQTPLSRKVCSVVKKIDGGAKITGAGGSILIHHDDFSELSKELNKLNLMPEKIKIGVGGAEDEDGEGRESL